MGTNLIMSTATIEYTDVEEVIWADEKHILNIKLEKSTTSEMTNITINDKLILSLATPNMRKLIENLCNLLYCDADLSKFSKA